MLRSGGPFERTVAGWALVHIAPTPKTVAATIPLMINALDHPKPSVRAEAATTLGDIGENSPHVTVALRKALKDKDETVRKAAEEATFKIDKSNR
jgi:HEAT repeat protein